MKLSVFLQSIAPQHLISRLIGLLAECRWVTLKNGLIKNFIKIYNVDVCAALSENINDYPNFNSFFIRQLKPELRPIVQKPNEIACPVDGAISQIGNIEKDSLIQAKGFYFSLLTLLGRSEKLAQLFYDGKFATLYLSPKDYHRVHMPLSGKLRETIYVPGKLFSVNTHSTQSVPNLFARNERLICIFETAIGPMAIILVGAMCVSSIHTVWDPSPQPRKLKFISYAENKNEIYLERGEELGYFKMGSTVIVLFPKNKIDWAPPLNEDSIVRMGQLFGIIR